MQILCFFFPGLARFGSQCVVIDTKIEKISHHKLQFRELAWCLGGTWRMGPHVVSGWLLGLQTSYNQSNYPYLGDLPTTVTNHLQSWDDPPSTGIPTWVTLVDYNPICSQSSCSCPLRKISANLSLLKHPSHLTNFLNF